MSLRTSPWPAGVPCWADLYVPDLDGAKRFYGEVLGWTFRDLGPDYGNFAIAQVRGADAAGMGPAHAGRPVAWTTYIASDDADKTAAAIADHGGTVLVPPVEIGPMGRLVDATDPTGARFSLWEAGALMGAGIVNEPGALTWEDLRSPDPDTARRFYEAVFGYRTEPVPAAGDDYRTFALPDEEAPLGGIGGMMGADHPHWLVYFGVADADTAVAAAEQSGGRAVGPAFDTPYGRMAGLADPAGATFFVIETEGQPHPDRSGGTTLP